MRLAPASAMSNIPVRHTGWAPRVVTVMALLLFAATSANASPCSSNATGNWSAPGTWTSCGGGVPTATDTVTIRANFTVTVDVSNAFAASVLIGGNPGPGTGTLIFNAGSRLTVSGLVTVGGQNGTTNGALQMTNGGTLVSQGLALGTGAATWAPGTGTVELTAANALPATIFASFNNLTIATGTTTLGGNIAVNGTLAQTADIAVGAFTLTVNGTHNAGTNTVSGAGGYTLAAAATLQSGSPTGVSGSITTTAKTLNTAANYTFNGSTAQVTGAAMPATVNNLTVNNAAGVTLSQNTATSGTLVVTAGTFTVGAFTYSVTGATAVSGTLSMTSTTGSKTFTGNVTINNGGAWNETANPAVSFGGSLQNDGTFTAGSGIHTFTGTAQTIGGANGIDIPNLTISGTTTNNGTLTVATALAGASTLTNGANAILNFGGSSITPTLTATALGNTINYTLAGAQTVRGTTYYNLTLSGSGTKSNASVTVNGTLSMQGTATASAAPTYGPTAVLEYKGSAPQTSGPELLATMPSGNNVIINNAAGLTLGANTTVSGTLTFTIGTVTTGANTLYIGSGGTVSRTSGYVVGNFKKFIPTGAASKTFEVGDASNYTPALVSFASVTNAGDLTVNVVSGDHANIGASTLIATQSVNRNWSLTNSGIVFTNFDATFTFVAGDVDGGANTNAFNVGRYSGGSWTYPTVGTRTSTSTQATGLTAFGEFQIATITYTISGHIQNASNAAISGVTVNLSGGQSSSTATDASGNYSFAGLPATNNYTVTPSHLSYTFSATSRTYNNLSANQTTADFTGTLVGYTISGHVADIGAAAISGVTVSLSVGQTSTTSTDASGDYSFAGLTGGLNYTVTPSKTDYAFGPPSRTFNNLGAAQVANFIAALVPGVTLTASVSPTGSVQPRTDLVYTISFSNGGAGPASAFVIIDPIPPNTDFKVGSVTTSLGTTGLTPTLAYSNDGGVTWTYTPSSAAGGAPAGYDRNVTDVRWSFAASLSPTPPNNAGSVGLTARIR